jgi:hypothetical protein
MSKLMVSALDQGIKFRIKFNPAKTAVYFDREVRTLKIEIRDPQPASKEATSQSHGGITLI